jgi:DNA mismatch repair protein MutL
LRSSKVLQYAIIDGRIAATHAKPCGMQAETPHIFKERPLIRQLDDAAVNRIAAGEVVERPASAVKELTENAIDAGARRISIDIADGGKTLIRITDDGHGMTADDLPLALSRHATSKIDGSDLLNIESFGFRGEALPSLGAVGRLSITSRAAGHEGAEITVSGSVQSAVKPAALSAGTVVELRDLFFATPARLKFMRSERAETQAISDVIRRLAMAEPAIGFVLRDVSGGAQRMILQLAPEDAPYFEALANRLSKLLGQEFIENALRIETEREHLRLTGYAALPTYSRGAAINQYIFVNGRPVRDKTLNGALRAAYSDVLSRDRHPAAALNITCDPHLVDVNVHPAKSEVRFRDPSAARSLIVSGLRAALSEEGHRASSTVAAAALDALKPGQPRAPVYQMPRLSTKSKVENYRFQSPEFAEPSASYVAQEPQQAKPKTPATADDSQPIAEQDHFPLGAARGQIHENYIIAQTENGLVIVDQHAAQTCADLLQRSQELAELGLIIEAFGGSAIAVRETPAILGPVSAKPLIMDLVDELQDLGNSEKIKTKIEEILSRISCHGSIRSGRRMRPEEMNALLRDMEKTPLSGQCNHGRPTYIELKLADIERLFGRS